MTTTSAGKARLSAQQLGVVRHVGGPLLVVAGPGSGKTRVLTERVRELLISAPGHFRVLALTFANRAADEMRERLADLGSQRQRAFIGTLHGFCLEVLAERGKPVGVEGTPHIFEHFKDRQELLRKAISEDPFLQNEINEIPDPKERGNQINKWLLMISRIKSHPITCSIIEDDVSRRVLDAYDAELRACNAYDFDDLLLLTYRLLTENPKLADFYHRLYKFICIDEAQDLNEAQYALICALSSDTARNIMLVGDPKQSIYGFNTSSPKYLEQFQADFNAKRVELTENFRSSQSVVSMARELDPNYLVTAQLPILGELKILAGQDEADEAKRIVDELEWLFSDGHPDVEGLITPARCAILGRTRFVLLAIEEALKTRGVPYFKKFTASHENESEVIDDFHLALRVIANPKDRLHFAALAKKWKVEEVKNVSDGFAALEEMAEQSTGGGAKAVAKAISMIQKSGTRLNLFPVFEELKQYADCLAEELRLPIYEDVEVLLHEWDQYLRAGNGNPTIAGFLSGKALGSAGRASVDGVALLTVHASKGLEFDVVFIAGMAEGTFPDYRARGKELEEERRNAFVAVTRSRRLLFLAYPAVRKMPWGDMRSQSRSRFIPIA